MKTTLFSIYDQALGIYGPIFQSPTMEAGIRMFTDIVKFGEENNRYRRHPQDYTLHHIGYFDDESCEFESVTAATQLASAVDCVRELTQDKGE